MKRNSLYLGIVGILIVVGAAAVANASEFDDAMQPVLTEYLRIHSALAADRLDGVKEAAQTIKRSAGNLHPEQTAGEHAEHFKTVPDDLVAACKGLEQAQDLEASREAFKALSKPVGKWAGMSKPDDLSVMYCPMAEAVWVQRGSEPTNPYFGTAMSGCGQKVGGSD